MPQLRVFPANFRGSASALRPLLPLCVLATVQAALVSRDLQAQTATVGISISVDAQADRHPISPEIYGVAHAATRVLLELNAPLNREGGNNTSRYNWQLNADNRGSDWYYESIPEERAVPGERGDRFINASRAAGAQAMLTMPTIGWVAKLGPNRGKLASFSIAKYGRQCGNDPEAFPDAGNGMLASTKQPILGNNPNDANVPADAIFQQDWVRHLVQRWGDSSHDGLRYYILDNEPSIWHTTHRDVHPIGASMEEVRDKIIDYAKRIKVVDPAAQIVAPEEWGWAGYLYSGYDQQYRSQHGGRQSPDRSAHAEQEYLPWLLDQLRQEQERTGRRVLDVFSVHYYPQGGEFSGDVIPATQLRRNRSTRSLWDPNYVDETWIKNRIQLIPRLRSWVNRYYPGTRIGITEYNWGAEGNINGATTQADLYGIFGREGLDLAARWTHPNPASPTFKAMKLYRNYDDHRSTFGDISVRTIAPNPDQVAAFGATRSVDGALTVMLINKQLSEDTRVRLRLANFAAGGSAEPWQLTAANRIVQLTKLPVNSHTINTVLPAQSVTLLVIPTSSKALD